MPPSKKRWRRAGLSCWDRRAVPALAALLGDEKLSHMARWGLEPLPYSEVDQALRESLRTLSGRQLVGVIRSIGVRKDPRAAKLLAERLNDADPDTAQAAARALGSIGTAPPPKPSKPRSTRCQTRTGSLSPRACFAVPNNCRGARRAGLRPAPPGREPPPGARRGAPGRHPYPRQHGIALLRESIQGDDLILVHAALRTSREMTGPEVTSALTANLTGVPADTQFLLLQTLGVRADPAALPAVTQLAAAGDTAVRLAAIRALAEIGAPGAVEPLVPLLRESDSQIAQPPRKASRPSPERKPTRPFELSSMPPTNPIGSLVSNLSRAGA